MAELTTLEASFLEAEDADQRVSLAVGALAVIDGPVPAQQTLVATLSERLRGEPRFTQRVRKHALELAAPEWVDDGNFETAQHVRWAVLPQPGDDTALFRIVADLMERRLDRERPLWECWIIEGLSDGRWAALLKVHLCIGDGIAAVRILASVGDAGPGVAFVGDIRTAKEAPSSIAARVGVSPNPLAWAGGLWRASLATTATAARTARGAAGFVTDLLTSAAGTSPPGSAAEMRHFGAARASLQEVEAICRAFGVTLDDVAVAAITDSFRTMLMRRGDKPRRNSLRALIAGPMCSPDASQRQDNRVAAALSSLPVEEHDPVRRLKAVHARLGKLNDNGERQAANAVAALTDRMPFAVSAWTARLSTRLPRPGVLTLTTNVAGPRQRMLVLGRPVEELLPVPPVASQLHTVISVLSYVDELRFGIAADGITPDVDELATGIELGIARLTTRALSRKPFGTKQSRRRLPLAN